jgi:hypothetical protein
MYYAPGRAVVEVLYMDKALRYFLFLPAMLLGVAFALAAFAVGMVAMLRRRADAWLALLGTVFSAFILGFFIFGWLIP